MKKFTTKANLFWTYSIPNIVVCIAVITAGVVWGFMQEPKNYAVMAFAVAIAVFIYVFMHTVSKGNYVITFTFEGAELHIDGSTRNSAHYVVYDVPASDFVLTQSPKEKELNRCTMAVKGTMFKYKNVENYTELKAYIEENFPKTR